MSIADLQSLCSQRKWFDCAEHIKALAGEKISEKDLQEVLKVYNAALPRMHLKSSSETATFICPLLPLKEAIVLLRNTETAILSQASIGDQHMNELMVVRMHLCLCKIKTNELENKESEIMKWKKQYSRTQKESMVILSRKTHWLLNLVAYEFYSRINNIEEAHKCLYTYISASGDSSQVERLLKLSIASKMFFDFSSVIALPGFTDLKNEELKTLFANFQKGNFSEIDKSEDLISRILREVAGGSSVQEYTGFVTEKVYLINILNVCFTLEHKLVSFDTFMDRLRIDEAFLLVLLLKALGTGIISGWIDSERRALFFNGILPRSLSGEDISDMKRKFVLWKDKVSKIIESIEAQ